MFGLYKQLTRKLYQWHLLHTRVWLNRLRRRYDSVHVHTRTGTYEYSEFPHPLVTLDFDQYGRLLGVEVNGTDLKTDLS